MVGEEEVRLAERPQHGRVRVDVAALLLVRPLLQELRAQALVAVEDEDGKQPVREPRPDDGRAAEVEPLRMPLLADDRDLVPGPAPLPHERLRVDVRAGAAQQVAVPDVDPHGLDARGGGELVALSH